MIEQETSSFCSKVWSRGHGISGADFLFCRFLLTHISCPTSALDTWARAAGSGALLVIHETETLESENETFRRYYEMLSKLQEHYGQKMNVGETSPSHFQRTKWQLVSDEGVLLRKDARHMAQLHAANLATWRDDPFALRAFTKEEVDDLLRRLVSLACGDVETPAVLNTARQIIARRS